MWTRVDPDILLKNGKPGTAAKYSNLPQQSLTSAAPNMRPTLDFNQPSRSTPVATDQKAGGSSPSDRAHELPGQRPDASPSEPS